MAKSIQYLTVQIKEIIEWVATSFYKA